MTIRKFWPVILLLAMIALICTGCGTVKEEGSQYRVCMITDAGDITDQSFNQMTYEACRDYCQEKNLDFTYKKPMNSSKHAISSMIDLAVAQGYNIIVAPGSVFAEALVTMTDKYPDVKFICLDISESDLCSAAVGQAYNQNPSAYNPKDYYNEKNTYCATYREEISGYLAGYAAVRLGYRHLGFLGGLEVPAVVRFGYGYLQGIEAAGKELGISDQISVEYAYGGQFYGSAEITAVMDSWYSQGTEAVFACGGAIYTSVAEAAVKYNGKVIGVDSDQKPIIDRYRSGLTLTSAMKNMRATIFAALDAITVTNQWDQFAGQTEALGLCSPTDPSLNYVGLPLESTQWNDQFTVEDYKKLLSKIYYGQLKISNETGSLPALSFTLNKREGTIK